VEFAFPVCSGVMAVDDKSASFEANTDVMEVAAVALDVDPS